MIELESRLQMAIGHILNNWSLSLYLSYGGIMAICLILIYFIYIIYRPLNRVRDLHEVGFWHVKDYDQRKNVPLRDLANEVIKQQKLKNDIPPVYPNGWFVIGESRDFKIKSVRPVNVLGQNLVIFRGEDGVINVLDAHCPHLGANLGIGSRVLGNCIECPFHGWRFKGDDGACAGIPYSDKIPSIAKIRKWDSREMNGFIYIWHHAENLEPYWEPVEMKEISSGKWSYRGRSEHYVKCHIQEIPENGADWAHLPQVHRANLLLGSDLRNAYNSLWDVAVHIWEASWCAGGSETPHISTIDVEHSMKLFGKINLITIKARVNQIGPATVQLAFSTAFGKAVLFQNVTPVEPLLQKVTHALYCETSMPAWYSKLIIIGEAIMVERDMMIWNHKVFLNKPLLIKEDKFIPKMRRWYSQFYSDNSPRLTFKKDTLDW